MRLVNVILALLIGFVVESRAVVGLVRPQSRPRIPGPIRGVGAHYNGPVMRLAGRPHSECRARWRGIQRFHMGRNHPNPHPNGRDWADIAYTVGVCHHGIAMEGRGPGVRTAANGTNVGNNQWYAIFFMVGGDEKPSREMLVAARQYASDVLGVQMFQPHSFFKATACPGEVRTYIANGRLTIPDSSSEEDDVYVVKFNEQGPRVRRAQKVLRAAGRKAFNNEDILPRFGEDGHYGDETATAMDRMASRAGLPRDGKTGMDVLLLDYCRNWLR